MPPSGWIQVDWRILGQAFALWPRGKRQWLSKHLARFSATGRVVFRCNKWLHDRRPLCNSPNEDSDHVNLCQAPLARAQWKTSLDAF
jgi:hypothetical protein